MQNYHIFLFITILQANSILIYNIFRFALYFLVFTQLQGPYVFLYVVSFNLSFKGSFNCSRMIDNSSCKTIMLIIFSAIFRYDKMHSNFLTTITTPTKNQQTNYKKVYIDSKMLKRHCNKINFYTKHDDDLALKCALKIDFDI